MIGAPLCGPGRQRATAPANRRATMGGVMSSASAYSTRFKIVAALVFTAAAGAFFLAYRSASGGGEDPVLSSGGADYVEELIPQRNGQGPRQSRVGIDLVTGWTGVLTINGTVIPEDQLTITSELGLVEFVPGEGQEIEELPGGTTRVVATVWPLSEGREEGARSVAWEFEVV